jgi:hypothetical protein
MKEIRIQVQPPLPARPFQLQVHSKHLLTPPRGHLRRTPLQVFFNLQANHLNPA